MWIEDLGHLDSDVFFEAIKRHRQRSEFFPTGKEILDVCQEIWRERKYNTPRLPEPVSDLSPEQLKENVKRVRQAIKPIGKVI